LNEYTYEFLPHRGISKETFNFYGVKTKIDAEGKPVALGFKNPNGSYLIRRLDRKDFYSEGDMAKAGLFGRDKFAAGEHDSVIIAEGGLDALSMHQVLRMPACSVQSGSTALRDCIVDREWINSFSKVYLAFDGDAAGREATAAVAKLFDYSKLYLVKFSNPNRKDANEYLRNGEVDELRTLFRNSKRYLPETIISGFDEFRRILTEETKQGMPYPFRKLNEMTFGIRTGEVVLITAQEGIGKTELMHTIEHTLLKETDYGIGAIFLEELPKRHLQSLAGIELKSRVHLPDSLYTNDQVAAALEKLIRSSERLHVFNQFGVSDPVLLLDNFRFLSTARGCRVILLDHVHMAVVGSSVEDERRALDYFSAGIEMQVKELDYAAIVVSHVNDAGQTRGSRYIGKSVDVRIDLNRDLLHPDPVERNTTYMTISKNKFAGRTGAAGRIVFDPLTGLYKEILDAQETFGAEVHDGSPRLAAPSGAQHAVGAHLQ